MPALDEILSLLPAPDSSGYRVLLVDDDESILQTLRLVLESNGYEVVSASTVSEALSYIARHSFDVLVTDLHMPEQGDGLTVVSAMRHSNPKAVTLIFSAFPEMQLAAAAILKQADDVIIKTLGVDNLLNAIRERLKKGDRATSQPVESVADILEREIPATIDDWLCRVDQDEQDIPDKLDREQRARYLPQLLRDLIRRLRTALPLGTRTPTSSAAAENGILRRQQGYTAAMLAEESRLLQVSIFQTLQNNLQRVDCSEVLPSVMAIADEVASQLAQAMTCYLAEPKIDPLHSAA